MFTISPDIVTGSGTQTIPYGDSLTVTRNLGATTDIQYAVRDSYRELNPDAPDGDWAGVMDDKAYESNGQTYAKSLQITVTEDAGSWVLPHGVPDAYGYGLNAGDPHEQFTWKLKGIASKLYRPKLSLPTVKSTRTAATDAASWSSSTTYEAGAYAASADKVWESLAADNLDHVPATSPDWWREVATGRLYYVRDVLGMVFDAYGVPYDVSGVTPNYLVAHMPMQNSAPVEWVKQLLVPVKGEWFEDADGIVCMVPANIVALSESTSYVRDWTTEQVKLRNLQFDQSAVVDYCNGLTVQRADDTGGVLAAVDQRGATFGRQGLVTLSQPVPVMSLHFTRWENVGKISNIYIYGPAGPPAPPIDARELNGAAPPVLQAGTMAYSFDFTFGAWNGSPVGATVGDFSLKAYGDNSFGVYADSDTSIEVGVPPSERGAIRDTLGPNLLLADRSIMQTWGDRELYTRSRQGKKVGGTIDRGDYGLCPGDRVRITDVKFNRARIYTVTQVQHAFPNNLQDRVTTFQAVTYE